MLRQEFNERLMLEQRIRAEVVLSVSPDRLGWAECGYMLTLYHSVVVVRV